MINLQDDGQVDVKVQQLTTHSMHFLTHMEYILQLNRQDPDSPVSTGHGIYKKSSLGHTAGLFGANVSSSPDMVLHLGIVGRVPVV